MLTQTQIRKYFIPAHLNSNVCGAREHAIRDGHIERVGRVKAGRPLGGHGDDARLALHLKAVAAVAPDDAVNQPVHVRLIGVKGRDLEDQLILGGSVADVGVVGHLGELQG